MLELAKNLRQEREKQKEMRQQEIDLKNTLQINQQRLNRLESQLRDIQKSNLGITPTGKQLIDITTP